MYRSMGKPVVLTKEKLKRMGKAISRDRESVSNYGQGQRFEYVREDLDPWKQRFGYSDRDF